MRILQLTPGTGDFHCGACLRDETLMRALSAMNVDTMMVPLYLPLVVDGDANVASQEILFGGVNVYLEQKSALFRKLPRWMDRWLASAWLLRRLARFAGMTRTQDLGELTVSMLQGEQGRQVKELERLIAWIERHDRPDAIVLSNVMLIGMARRLRSAFDCPVVCTLQGEDGFLDALPRRESEAAWRTLAERAPDVDAFIAVSAWHGELMSRRLGLAEDRVTVVHNGIDLSGYEPAPSPPATPTIGYLARMCAPKGLDMLAKAFVILRNRGRVPGAVLRIAGARNASDELYVDVVRGILKDGGVLDQASFHPNLTLAEKQRFLRELSVLSVPATYGESFGLYVIEALACGVPVVQPRHAAFPELLSATGGGILCDPDDAESLALALESLLLDEDGRAELRRRGRQAVIERFSAGMMARGVLDVIERARGAHPAASAPSRPPTSNPISHERSAV